MYAVPDVEEVVEVARSLGIHLGAEEAVLYRTFLLEQLKAFDEFVQSRIPEDRPPLLSPAREPGYRPSDEEDPFRAWLWKCRIDPAGEGVLSGKMVSFKDHTAVAGVPLTFGSFPLEDFIPDFDATIVTRTLEAGGTIVGKHMMNGLTGGFGAGGGIGDHGRPKNPHDPDHVTGGSSSGSAAALAAGEVDISFGGDQGGSIRIPAALSGTVGHKPTFGVVSHFGIGFGSDQSIDYTGPMAMTVEDTAAAMQATAGADGYDPRQPRDLPERIDVMTGLDGGVAGLRIGVLDEGFVDAEPDVADGVMAAVEVLSEAGAEVAKVSVPEHLTARQAQAALAEGQKAVFDTGFFGAFTRTYYPASLIAAINKMWATEADLMPPRTKLALIAATFAKRNFHGRVYAKAQNVRPTFIRAYDQALADVDLLVMPTVIQKAPRYEAPDGWLAAVEDNLAMSSMALSRNTQPFNYTGHPALALPVGKASGLPVSLQLVGRFHEDALVLRAAYAYQHAVDWDEVIAVGR